jgi:glycosyltransferase involved in cell wall biosynthesis
MIDIDVLMISYQRPEYTSLALDRLLATAEGRARVWLWHNGTDDATLEVVRSRLDHPAVYRFHHSPENQKLRQPTNWMWSKSDGAYVSKVDDDCLVPEGWLERLRCALESNPELGAAGCWRFHEDDFDSELATRKIVDLKDGSQLLQNCWVEGSGYLMKRACVEDLGPIPESWSFTGYCKRLALRGWKIGWLYPFLLQEHMDDPRAPHTLLRTDEDMSRHAPLSAQQWGLTTLEEWEEALRNDAMKVLSASVDPRDHVSPWVRLQFLVRKLAGHGGGPRAFASG